MPASTTPPEEEDTSTGLGVDQDAADFIATTYLGYDSYEDYMKHGNALAVSDYHRMFIGLTYLINNAQDIYDAFLEDGTPPDPDVGALLDAFVGSSEEALVNLMKQVLNLYRTEEDDDEADDRRRIIATCILALIDLYAKYKAEQLVLAENPEDAYHDELGALMSEAFDLSGQDSWKSYLNHLYTPKRAGSFLLRTQGKWRNDEPPQLIAPWECRIGGATFYVPPVNINVSQAFRSGSISGAAIRQPNTAKFNTGHSETVITMTLYFPNHETIWGFKGDTQTFNWDPPQVDRDGNAINENYRMTEDGQIDYFLSSLRGLITQFKFSPFLPVRNQYLNQTYDISAVTLTNMTVSTMPDYPFCLVATLEMAKFNHKVYLPMIEDFDQAIHWGKFRQYMGKAAARMDALVNQGFIVEPTPPSTEEYVGTADTIERRIESEIVRLPDSDINPTFDKARDIADGKYFEIYYPTTTPSRIFSPDTNDFRQPGEDNVVTTDMWGGALDFLGFDTADKVTYNFLEFDTVIRNRTSSNERLLLLQWLEGNSVMYDSMTSSQLQAFIAEQLEIGDKRGTVTDDNRDFFTSSLKFAWMNQIYVKLMNDTLFKDRILNSQQTGKQVLKEWKIPMAKLYLDWNKISIQGVNVSLANTIVRHQVQMQDEPVHQHIGGGDSRVDVSMIIVGEDNLIRLRRVFEHIGGLARLEHGSGVLGFLGIKNVVTALCGIKYVVPLTFEVDTIPNYPRAYNVRLSFVDFDILQQVRESLSSNQQRELVEAFGKRNPFLRLKQKWGAFNGYPDMPLDVRDDENKIVGHLDPDWYFRSFRTDDDDLMDWKVDETNNLSILSMLKVIQNNLTGIGVEERRHLGEQIHSLEEARRLLSMFISNQVDLGYALPNGFEIDDNGLIISSGAPIVIPEDGSPFYCYLGTLSKDQDKLFYMKSTRAGTVTLGYYDPVTGEHIDDSAKGTVTFSEDLATKNVQSVMNIDGTVPLPLYQNEYFDKSDSPAKQFELMMKDWRYRQIDHRMLRAFPTYMLWLIDEGGQFAGMDLLDNFYGLNSVVDFSVVESEDCIEDTLILRVSNIYQRLSTPLKDSIIAEEDPLEDTTTGRVISAYERLQRNLISGLTNTVVEINNVRLKPGVRLHLRAGYGANPNSLQTLFNGVITSVEYGDVMTITAQTDAIELTAMVNSTDVKGHSGKIDGGINTGFWLSEPRDLIVRLLSMGSSAFKEYISRRSAGTIFSENRFGIRHFGSINYEIMSSTEQHGHIRKYRAVQQEVSDPSRDANTRADVTEALGEFTTGLSDFGSFSSIVNGSMVSIMEAMWLNGFRKRDYEIFKRNIYPGNGLGIAQYMAGDQIDAGLTLASVQSQLVSIDSDETASGEDSTGEKQQALVEQNKTIIEDFKTAASLDQESIAPYLDQIRTSQYDGADGDITNASSAKYAALQSTSGSMLGWVGSGFGWAFNSLANMPAWSIALGAISPLGAPIVAAKTLRAGYRISQSPLMQAFGIVSPMQDDDLPGYDEISFRAQTYMKTVWDLFQTCAALLPNYIVAVRPFEDRSTVFYGKPHWLYTSGVIPITAGRNKTLDEPPFFEKPDAELEKLVDVAKQNQSSFEILQRQLAEMRGLNSTEVLQNQYSSQSVAGGSIDIEAVNELPSQWPDSEAFIWKTEGWASREMHIPSAGEDVVAKTGHMQLAELEERHKWPYNMDRAAGDGNGGGTPREENGYVVDWGGGDSIVGSSQDTYYGDEFGIGPDGSIGNEDPSLPGSGSALWGSDMPPEQEQYYIAMPWPVNSYKDVKWGFPNSPWSEVLDKISKSDLSYDDYRNKKVLVYSVDTGRACVCAPGDYGPNPFSDGALDVNTKGGHICGLSPDVHLVLGTDHGSQVIVKAFPDEANTVPYGPYGVGVAIATTDPNANADWGQGAGQGADPNPNADWGDGTEPGTDADPNADWGSGTGATYDPNEAVTINVEGVEIAIPGHLINVSEVGGGWVPKALSELFKKYAEWNGIPMEGDLPNIGAYLALQGKGKLDEFKKLVELAYRDPIIFAYQFGWALSDVPAYISLSQGIGVDTMGMKAKNVWSKSFNPNIAWDTGGRDEGEGADVWNEFRLEYPTHDKPREIYDSVFPGSTGQENAEEIMDMFMRFMWQIPFARGWLIIVSDKKTLTDKDDTYQFNNIDPAWKTFLTANDVVINEAGTPYSPATISYMQQNMSPGADTTNPLSGAADGIKSWWDNNVGNIMGMIGDTISGVLSAIRISLMQAGIGLSQASNMQRQANIFNSALFDSIYYQAGSVDTLGRPDLARLADNPFTREYGEPVIEIREPFQRVHFISSFEHILSNGITENINGVSTVITAVSDGKYPVTVHFDKSISPEKQMESVVETGLFWDNALGSGITGMFQPLIHPIESLRSVAKTAMGSSDLLSSRRVGLYYLKESLKDIYTGELLILGNADIRPHDLIYLADVYERMYGMFEVEKVIHHFTPELGFITSIVPNALVSVNDPARWSMISWMWKKFSDYNLRNDTRAMLNAKMDRTAAMASKEISSRDIGDLYSTQIGGAIQWTQGNTSLVKDLSAMYGTGGMKNLSEADELANTLSQVNTTVLAALGGMKTAAVAGGIAVGVLGAPQAGAAVAAGGYVVGDLLWDAWQWVRDNLLDQHGCYIQYMTKDGQAMDAGLSSAQGVAVGQAHSIDAFPTILGVDSRLVIREDGHYRITTNDILKAMGWSEVETAFIQRQTSWFVNNINSNVLKLAGRDDQPDSLARNYAVLWAKVLDPVSENGVEDGDTLNVYVQAVTDNYGITTNMTGIQRIRLANVNTAEVLIHDKYWTDYDESQKNPLDDLGLMSKEYLESKFELEENRYIAIRVTPQANGTIYDRADRNRIVGVVFHQLPKQLYSDPSLDKRKEALTHLASRSPFIPWDSYMEDGRPYTLNWELVMTGFGNVDVRDSIYDSPWRDGALGYSSNVEE